ncbi:MAG: aminoglycoside/choline kinase family phosphotransferase [Candidatus Azotimanducaceae bacterium]
MIEESKVIRKNALSHWASEKLREQGVVISPDLELSLASDDASFRRYFRTAQLLEGVEGIIFVDAPPQHENSEAFIRIAKLISNQGLSAPNVIAYDLNEGFMMLSDFGNNLYLDELEVGESRTVDWLYESALSTLAELRNINCESLPLYNETLLRGEIELFSDWFLSKLINLPLNQETTHLITSVCDLVVKNALEQPQVFVHRDYHSRNLMVLAENNPGLIDFQDAVKGPITYDLVSLLKDCYWQFPRKVVVEWVKECWRKYDLEIEFSQFLRWFDLMGMQRHLKCAGIFSRLNIRDGKSRYLQDIPLVISYLLEVCENYDELEDFGIWLKEDVQPKMIEIIKTEALAAT